MHTNGLLSVEARGRQRWRWSGYSWNSVGSFLKTQYGMKVNKARGLGRVAVYALYSVLCHVLTREAAENMGRPDKAVSPTFFNT